MVRGDRMRNVLQQNGFTGARRCDDQATLAFAKRGDQINNAGGQVLGGRNFEFHLETLVWIERRQIVEMDLVADLFGILEIDRIDLEQSEITFAFLRATDRAFDGIAGFQREAPDLRGGNIDIVRPRQVIGIGRAQEAEAVLQHFNNAFADDLDVLACQHFQDRKHQFLLAHDTGVFDLDRLGKRQEIGSSFVFKFL